MGRSNKSHAPATKHGKSARKMQNFTRLSTTAKPKSKARDSRGKNDQGGPKKKKQQQQHQQQRKPVIPFRPSDRILLVGEGDLSFAASLANKHGCHRILATCYDNERTVHQKYPQARKNVNQLKDPGSSGSLPQSSGGAGVKRKRDEDEDDEDAADDGALCEGDGRETSTTTPGHKHEERSPLPKVLFSIDARKLGASPAGGGKLVRKGVPRRQRSTTSTKPKSHGNSSAVANSKNGQGDTSDGGPWDVICFNFPHVGGLSTDVNRQVRANQELLVSFFKACEPLLSPPPPPGDDYDEDDWGYDSDEYLDLGDEESDTENHNHDRIRGKARSEPGQIIVTLFEGEPYTLWNIRDLARHVGLRVVTSFEFPWTSYQGYSHARTVGEIESKKGGRGGWRGEDREARSYVFERKDHEPLTPKASGKRRKGGSEDDSDD